MAARNFLITRTACHILLHPSSYQNPAESMTSTLRLAAKMDITIKSLHPALQDQITSLIKTGDGSSKEEHKKSKDKGKKEDKEQKKDKGKKEKKERKEDKKDRSKAEGVEEKDKVKKEKEKDKKDKQSEGSKSHKKAFFVDLKSTMAKAKPMTQFGTCCLRGTNRYLFLVCH